MQRDNAYTLVETLIGALFIAIALVVMACAFINASHILQKSRHTLTAVGYLQKWAEFYRNESFSDISNIPTDTDIPLDVSDAPLHNPELYLTVEEYDADDNPGTTENDIRKVSLRVSWDESSGTITKKMATLITDEGINP